MMFYDPHPGFGGAIVPLPEKVRQYAASIDGQDLKIDDVITEIQALVPSDWRVEDGNANPILKAMLKMDCILLKTPHGEYPIHSWRVLRYRPAETADVQKQEPKET